VTFKDGATTLGTASLSGGSATFTTAALVVGGHSITVSYAGDTNFTASSSSTLTQTVNKDATTSAVSSSVNPSLPSQSVTFTATVTANGPGSGTPTGTVTFLDGSTTLATVSLSGGTATFTTSSLANGSHPITVSYGGDSSFSASTSPVLTQSVGQDGSTTTVASSANPSAFGQAVTFTATVTANTSGNTPTGTVTFLDGSTTLGTATLSGGSGTFTTTGLAVGSHSITVSYGGDTNFTGSTSGVLTQTVNKDGTSSSVTSSANPSVSGQSVTFTATVSASGPGSGTPTGTVTFKDGTTTIGTGSLSGGTATFSTSTLSIGSHSITVSYGGDSSFTGSSSSTLTQTVNQDGTTASVSSSLNPSSNGQSVTFTATVSASGPGSGTPTGTVTFKDGTTTIGTGSLSGGTATFSTSTLSIGSHSITVSYAGDANFSGSTSPVLTQTVSAIAATTTTVTSSANPSVYRQLVTFTATVSPSAGPGTPTGTVTFKDGSTVLSTATLSGGSATYQTSTLTLGSHSITVVYGGDASFSGSTSAVLTQAVNQDPSVVSVSSSANPAVFGQSVTFTATVQAGAPGSGTPTGTVTFKDGSTVLGTATLSAGSATFSTHTLTVGGHAITVSYGGDSNFTGGTSPTLTETVNQDPTTTTLTSSLNPSAPGQSVTFTATVAANSPGAGMPTGQATFSDGGTVLATITLSGGSASFTTSTLALGSHSITVAYGGDTNFAASGSSVLTQTVENGSTITTVVAVPNPSFAGLPVTITATVTPVPPLGGVPTGTVTFKNNNITTVAVVTLDSHGQASYTAIFNSGHYVFYAYYSGDAGFAPSSGSVIIKVTGDPGGGGGPFISTKGGPSIPTAGLLPVRTFRQLLTLDSMAAASIAAAGVSAGKAGNGSSTPAVTTPQTAAKTAPEVSSVALNTVGQTGAAPDLLGLARLLAGSGSGVAPTGSTPAGLSNVDWLFANLASEESDGQSATGKSGKS
jgi:hypothetical protein